MKLRVMSALCTMSLALAPAVFATESSQDLDLAQLKLKCNELQANEQLKPFKAIVSCKQSSTEWRPSSAQAAPIEVANYKEIGASFSLKGYAVPFNSETIAVSASFASCSVLEEVQMTVPAVDFELACGALEEVESIAEICGPAIDARIENDPSIVIEKITGRTFNSCG